jgi:hypothetical protein
MNDKSPSAIFAAAIETLFAKHGTDAAFREKIVAALEGEGLDKNGAIAMADEAGLTWFDGWGQEGQMGDRSSERPPRRIGSLSEDMRAAPGGPREGRGGASRGDRGEWRGNGNGRARRRGGHADG